MKKSLKVFAFACSFSLVLGLSSCSNGSDLDSRENSGSSSGESSGGTTSGGTTTGGTTTGGATTGGTTAGGGTSGTHITSQVIKSGLKFDFSNAKAIAAVDKENSGRAAYSINSRAATPDSSVDDSPLLKILEDGKFESALTLADNANLANIKEIYKSPLEGSNDIFIVFDGTSSFYDEQVTVDENGNTVSSNSVYKTLGQLVCIHEDNTIADILKINDSENSYDTWQNYLSLETDKGVMFDAAGNLYYMARKWNSSGDMSIVYKFDPKTNEITELTASVSGTNYSSFKITKDGKIIFVQGQRDGSGSSATFLRAIPVDDPNNFSSIYYSSGNSWDFGVLDWVYDEKNEVIYYVPRDKGLYKAERSGNSFKTGELIGTSTGSELNAGRYFSSDSINVADWRANEVSYWVNNEEIILRFIDDNENLIPENVARYIIEACACGSSAKYGCLSIEDVDIRFDVFKNIEGYEDIYNATKGLKNAEAIKALDTFKLRNLFYDVFDYSHGYYGYTKNYISKSSAYKHNLLADILYVKDSDTLLCNSDEPINSSTEVKGSEYFGKNGDYSKDGNISVFSTQYKQGFLSVSNNYKKSDGSVDCSAILKNAFSNCYTHGEKEFRLDTFKDDGTYGALYSDLTDEEALKWIIEDDERLFWFGNAFSGEWDGNKYVSAKNFTDLFFIKGTNEPAYKQSLKDVCYSRNYGEVIKDYTVNSDGSLWARYTNTNSSWSSEEDKYFYFVQITDSDGCLINDFNEVNLPSGKVSQTIENDGALYMKYSLLTSNGGETGFHQIYKVNFADGAYVNMFKNVPNNEKLEVISYSVGADRLYYSAVRGTSVENGVVSTVTNEYNPLEITKKLSAIYTF